MGIGRSLVIGVVAHGPELPAVENDYNSIKTEFQSRFGTENVITLAGSEATADAVLRELQRAADELKSGDLFVFYYAGHGGEQPQDDPTEAEPFDQTLCTFGPVLVDDELGKKWKEFKAGVRIVVLTDSCHSETVVREMRGARGLERIIEKRLLKAASAPPLGIGLGKSRSRIGIVSRDAQPIEGLQASLLHLAGCRDVELSQETGQHGIFTDELLRQLNAQIPNYVEFCDNITSRVASRTQNQQNATVTYYGYYRSDFFVQKPLDPTEAWPPG